MNPTTKNNVLTWLVVVLMLANIGVITLFLMGRHHQEEKRGTPGEFLVRELNLDTKQQAQLHELASKHHTESEKIRGEIKDARDHFFDLIKQPNVNDSAKNATATEVADKLKALDLLTFDHFRQVRMICTPEQQVKFDKVLNEAMRMIGGPPPGPRQGGPGGRKMGPPREGPPGNDSEPPPPPPQ